MRIFPKLSYFFLEEKSSFLLTFNITTTINNILAIYIKTIHSDPLVTIFYGVLIIVFCLKEAIKKHKIRFYKIFIMSNNFAGYLFAILKVILFFCEPFLFVFTRIFFPILIKDFIVNAIVNLPNSNLPIGVFLILSKILSTIISSVIFFLLIKNFVYDTQKH